MATFSKWTETYCDVTTLGKTKSQGQIQWFGVYARDKTLSISPSLILKTLKILKVFLVSLEQTQRCTRDKHNFIFDSIMFWFLFHIWDPM